MDFIIKEKLEEAWAEQDISKFNALLDLQKRYEEGEDGALNLFILDENQKKLERVKQVIEKKLQQDKEYHNSITAPQRIAEIEKFLNSQRI